MLSVNEGGRGKGRGDSNGSAASKSRPRLSIPAETARHPGIWAKDISSCVMMHMVDVAHLAVMFMDTHAAYCHY